MAYQANGQLFQMGEVPEFEDQVRRCMKRQGFTYIEEERRVDIASAYRGGLEVGSEQFIESLGFGISTQMFHQEALPEDLVGFPRGVLDDLASQQTGADRFGGMSATEIDAYVEALHGDDGCLEKTTSDWFRATTVFYFTYADELNELEEAVRSDQRILDRDATLSRCVAEQGYADFVNVESTVRTLKAEAAAIRAPAAAGVPVPAYAPISVVEEAKLRDLQTVELGLAAAVFECDPAIASTDELFLSVLSEYEQRFVCEHLGC